MRHLNVNGATQGMQVKSGKILIGWDVNYVRGMRAGIRMIKYEYK